MVGLLVMHTRIVSTNMLDSIAHKTALDTVLCLLVGCLVEESGQANTNCKLSQIRSSTGTGFGV